MIEKNPDMNCYTIESMEQFELLKNIKSDIIIPVMNRITSGSQFGVNEEEAIKEALTAYVDYVIQRNY